MQLFTWLSAGVALTINQTAAHRIGTHSIVTGRSSVLEEDSQEARRSTSDLAGEAGSLGEHEAQNVTGVIAAANHYISAVKAQNITGVITAANHYVSALNLHVEEQTSTIDHLRRENERLSHANERWSLEKERWGNLGFFVWNIDDDVSRLAWKDCTAGKCVDSPTFSLGRHSGFWLRYYPTSHSYPAFSGVFLKTNGTCNVTGALTGDFASQKVLISERNNSYRGNTFGDLAFTKEPLHVISVSTTQVDCNGN